jgi:hypothetical protein
MNFKVKKCCSLTFVGCLLLRNSSCRQEFAEAGNEVIVLPNFGWGVAGGWETKEERTMGSREPLTGLRINTTSSFV